MKAIVKTCCQALLLGSTLLIGAASFAQQFIPAVQQTLSPAGLQVGLKGMRPQALALSPDGKILATSGKTSELVLIDPVTGAILQRVALPGAGATNENSGEVSPRILLPDKQGQLSFTGLIFSPDGRRIFLSNVGGSVKVFAIGPDHRAQGLYSIALPETRTSRKQEIPAGLAISPDGKRLYVALNLSNRLLEYDLEAGKILRTFDVGVAPFDVVLHKDKVYVSNWGGRRPAADSLTGPAGRGTLVRVDPVRHIANEGSVTVIDLANGKVTGEIIAGLHASALALTRDGKYLCVANAGSDSVSIIDTRKDEVVETIPLAFAPNDLLGATPNALALSRNGKILYACNGTQNAVAVIALQPGGSKLTGFIPVGWYPGAVLEDAPRHRLYVANIKGLQPANANGKYNTHEYYGTLSLLQLPNAAELAKDTQLVIRNYRRAVMTQAMLPPRADAPPCAVPERVGEPSLIKHVVYIVKENRTYDQVLGDVKAGNGRADLCIFGERVTPNQHKLVRDFVLLDNLYCSGILSADGHQWAMSAFATDYIERSFCGFPRSYPDGMDWNDVDALVYSPAGFIWDNAVAHGRTFRNYGEYTIGHAAWKNPQGKKDPTFKDSYEDFLNHTGLIKLSSVAGIWSLTPYTETNTVGWSQNVPDVMKADKVIQDLRAWESQGAMPNLIIVCLPSDHTAGTKAGKPTPEVFVADNDLAVGQLVEAFSHSRFWKETCLFAIEDDPQNGWDHVSGYRTTAYVASPYTRRHATISTPYNQPGMLRTMELMLGLPPMNQMDASATPMFDCFTNTPDFTPFDSVTNQVPFNLVNPPLAAIHDAKQRRYARASAKLRFDQPDQCPEQLLNQILWNIQKGSRVPFPTWAVVATVDND